MTTQSIARICRAGLAWLAVLCLSALPSTAQSTFATLTGLVTDPSGAPVVGAQITVVNVGTGYEYKATSDEQGQYLVPNLLEEPIGSGPPRRAFRNSPWKTSG